jgi:hypothetical protein
MSKVVCSPVCLNYCELQLSHNLVIDDNLQSDVADGEVVRKSALNFSYPVASFLILLHECFYFANCLDYVIYLHEHTLSPHHVADIELDFLFCF